MKQALRLLRLLALAAALPLLAASVCERRPPERQWQRGAFLLLPANTQAYQLPSGISMVSIFGNLDPTQASDLPLLATVHNSGQENVDVTLPAGLVFAPASTEYQYMILLQDFHFIATTGDRNVTVPTYCCNVDLYEPDEESPYYIAGREWDLETEELLDLVADKSLSGEAAVMLAQDALYEITDGDGLTDTTRARLDSLP